MEALGAVRPVEGRLTGQPFAPFRPVAGGPRRSKKLLAAASRIQREAWRRPLPRSLGNLGVLYLVLGKPNQAVPVLERAVVGAPGDAPLLSDLTAAHLARAGDGVRPYDLLRALSVVDRAVHADPQLPEARFNRALALEKLHLTTDARQAWEVVLRREVVPGWAAEARARLKDLTRPVDLLIWESEIRRLDEAAGHGRQDVVAAIVGRFPQPARLYAEEKLLADWAEHADAGREWEADRTLRIARAIGTALVRRGGDAMVHDAVAAIDGARQRPSSGRLQHLVEGHRTYGRGLRQYKSRRRVEIAIPDLVQAERELRRAGSPFALWARVYLASCAYFERDYARARLGLGQIRRDLPADRYPSLLGRILWIVASMDVLGGRAGDALPLLQQARRLFEKADEVEDWVAMHELLALGFDALGESEAAWAHLLAGLRARHRVHTPDRVFALLDGAGMACLRKGELAVARYFQNELLADSLTRGRPEFVSFAHLRRARTLHLSGRRDEAMRDLAAAARTAQKIAAGSTRERLGAEIGLARGEIELARDPETAVRSLSPSIAVFERARMGYYLSMAYFLRARALLALEREEGASRDFLAGLREIEEAGESVIEEPIRIALYDQATVLFDEILTFQASRAGGENEAFETSERVRARQLLDRSSGKGPLLSADQVRQSVPDGTVLLKYVVLPDQILVWALDSSGVVIRKVSVSATALAATVERVRNGLRRTKPRPQVIADLRDLHRILVAPVESTIGEAHSIVFIPDKSLHLLPFGALIDPRTKRYLVQDRAVSVAPSANIYMRCLLRSRELGAGPFESALVVAADAFDRRRFRRLSSLEAVEAEARLVAAEYPRNRLLTGREATRRQFQRAVAEKPEVIHFAGHSVVNPERPDLSMLVFAGNPGNGDSGVVYSHEVDELRLESTRLVVLSACSTAAGRVSESEGVTSLARPFLAAGVPAVLASLWEVDDPATAKLLTRFHRHLRAGDDPVAALRAAQLSLLGGSPPSHWAAFQVIGGVPPLRRR